MSNKSQIPREEGIDHSLSLMRDRSEIAGYGNYEIHSDKTNGEKILRSLIIH